MTTAFAITAAVVPRASAFTGTHIAPMRPSTIAVGPSMALKTESDSKTKSPSFSRLEANKAAKEAAAYRGPQGFTPYAEKVNGRLAQMGFVIGLITEIVSGKPMGEQMLIMFGPLTHALQSLGL